MTYQDVLARRSIRPIIIERTQKREGQIEVTSRGFVPVRQEAANRG